MAVPAAPFEIEIPFTGGLDEVSDSVTSDPPQLLRADNAIFTKKGAVARRPGMDGKAATGLTGQRANCIFERGGDAHVLTDGSVYSHRHITDDWVARNPKGITPCQLRTGPLVRVANIDTMHPDSAVHPSGYIATVWMTRDPVLATFAGGPTANTRCYIQITDRTTGNIITPATMLPTTMRGVPHVHCISGAFVITAMHSNGHVYGCAMAPTAAVPGSATDMTGVAYDMYDTFATSTGVYIVAPFVAAGIPKFDIWLINSSVATTASKLNNNAGTAVSVRGIGVYFSTVTGKVYVGYVDGITPGVLTSSTFFMVTLDAGLTTLSGAATCTGTFNPRTTSGGAGASLSGTADVTITYVNASGGYILAAWSCPSLTINGVTSATNAVAYNAAGSATTSNVGTTRGYRLVGKASQSDGVTGVPYLLLGWNGPLRSDTPYPAHIVVSPIVGPEWDSAQTPPTTRTAMTFRAVARANRDVAYSDIIGSTTLPHLSSWWADAQAKWCIAAPVKKQAGTLLHTTIVYETNLVVLEIDSVKPSRKLGAHHGKWFDGGYDGGFDGQQAFESSLHQPVECTKNLAFGATKGNSLGDTIFGWGAHTGDPPSTWNVLVSASWQDMDGNLHRSAGQSFQVSRGPPGANYISSDGILTMTDPGALSAIELYGAMNVRIQVYVSANVGGATPSSDGTPYLVVDDVIGANTMADAAGAGYNTTGYQISLNGQAGLITVRICNPYDGNPIDTTGQPTGVGPAIPHYTLGSVLAAEPSHALADLVWWQDRLVGIDSENLLRLPYTKPAEDRIAPEWNGTLGITVPAEGGDAIGLAVMDEKLIVLKEHAIYVVVGNGATATGLQEQLDPQRLPSDVGCSSRNSIVVIPDGVLFLSQRGPVLLDRGLVIRRPRSLPDTFTTATCAVVLPHLQQVVWGDAFTRTIAGPITMYGSATLNYEQGQWSLWWPFAMLDGVVIDSVLWRLDMSGQNSTVSPDATPCVALENEDSATDPQGVFPLDVQTAWIKTAGVTGFQRLKRMFVRATRFNTSAGAQSGLTLRMYVDYDELAAVGTSAWTSAEATAVAQGQYGMHVPAQKCSAASFRVTESSAEFDAPTVIQGLTLRGLRRPMESKNLGAGAKK